MTKKEKLYRRSNDKKEYLKELKRWKRIFKGRQMRKDNVSGNSNDKKQSFRDVKWQKQSLEQLKQLKTLFREGQTMKTNLKGAPMSKNNL